MPRNKSIADEALLERCRLTFLAKGIGVSTRELAKSVGVSEATLFARFKTKDELFFLAMRLPSPDLSKALAEARSMEAEAGLIVLASAALAYLRAQMPALLLVLSHPDYLARSRPAATLMNAREVGTPFRALIAEKASHPDPDTSAQLLVSALITRALHEAVGVMTPARSTAWLTRTVHALTQE